MHTNKNVPNDEPKLALVWKKVKKMNSKKSLNTKMLSADRAF